MSASPLERLREAGPLPRPERPAEDATPQPGDVFAFAATAEAAVLWALVRQDPIGARLLAVAADHHPLVGSRDVAVPPGSACGALTLRCGVDVWLAAADFAAARRVGRLEPDVLRQVRARRAAIEDDAPHGSVLERETDHEWEYRHALRRRLETARAALAEPRGRVLEMRVPRRPAWTPARWAAAAALLVGVGLGLAGGLAWRMRDADPLVDQPFAWLAPLGERRQDVPSVVVPFGAELLVLILTVHDPDAHSRYRLEVLRKADLTPLWNAELARTGAAELTVILPRRSLAVGELEIVLRGLDGGEARPVGRYALRVALE